MSFAGPKVSLTADAYVVRRILRTGAGTDPNFAEAACGAGAQSAIAALVCLVFWRHRNRGGEVDHPTALWRWLRFAPNRTWPLGLSSIGGIANRERAQ